MSIDVVVFVPGICGSVLKDGDLTIWPGTPMATVFQDYPDAYVGKLANSPTLVATDVLRSVPLTVLGIALYHFDGYGQALEALKGLGFLETNNTLIPFAYDWRKDIATVGAELAARLAKDDLQGRRVAVVAHSMGGLVARYALEELKAPAELCVLVATPHLGAPAALQNIIGNRPEIFLSAAQCRTALGNPNFPSAYQLLPRENVPVLREKDSRIGFKVRTLSEAPVVAQLDLASGSLSAAEALARVLVPMGPGFTPPCRYVAIAGNAQKTITANYLTATSAIPVEEDAAGDGTVPLWSAAPPGIPVRYVSATHGDMFKDSDTVDILQSLLRPDRVGTRLLEVAGGKVPLSIQLDNSSVAAGTAFTIWVCADQPTTGIDAVVRLTELTAQGRSASVDTPISYRGGPLRRLALTFKAPDTRAVLAFDVFHSGEQPQGNPASVIVLP